MESTFYAHLAFLERLLIDNPKDHSKDKPKDNSADGLPRGGAGFGARVGHALFVGFPRLTSVLPLWFLHWLAGGLGWVFAVVPNRSANTTRRNLTVCFPELSSAEREQLARRSLVGMVCTALEMGKAWLLPLADTLAQVTEVEGLDALRKAAASGDGVILLAPHLGNWEIFGYYACEGIASNFMYQPPKSPPMDELLRQVRAKSGVKLAPTNRRGVGILLSSLQKGEMVGVLPDQVPADEGGVFADFFGQSAFTMTLTSRLAQRGKPAVFCGFAQRLAHGKGFKVIVRPADSGVFDPDLQRSAAAINRSVEACVALAPEQYQWEYKRFRRQADNSEFY